MSQEVSFPKLAIAVAGIAIAATAFAQLRNNEEQVVTGFRVPTYDREGNLTSQVFGDRARILPNGLVDIVELRMEFYGGEGGSSTNRTVEMRISSPRCLYNRVTGNATSDAPVRISRDNMVVTGVGFQWFGDAQRFEIYSNAKVVLKDIKRGAKTEFLP